MNNNPNYVPTIFQAKVCPAFAAIFRTPHAAETFAYIAAHGFFTLAHINNGFIAWCHGYRANAAAKKAIGNVFPVAASIGRFPNTATCSAKVKNVFVDIATRYRGRAPTPKRPYQPVFKPFEYLVFGRWFGGRWRVFIFLGKGGNGLKKQNAYTNWQKEIFHKHREQFKYDR
jgi:hypothetical protein